MLLLLLISTVTLWLITRFIAFLRSYRLAKSLSIPVVVSPVGILWLPWAILQHVLIRPIESISPFLPCFMTRWAVYFTLSSWHRYRYAMHDELGEVHVHSSPEGIAVMIANPSVVERVLERKSGIDKPLEIVQPMDIYGPNLATVVGPEWAKQRRWMTPSFNDGACRLVWDETLRQMDQMLATWKRKQGTNGQSTNSGIRTIAEDTKTMTLHVITQAGFGVRFDFDSDEKFGHSADGANISTKPSYRDCFAFLLANADLILAVPDSLKYYRWLPKRIRDYIIHKHELGVYMREMVEDGKKQAERVISHKDEQKANILSTLVLNSEQARRGLFDEIVAETKASASKDEKKWSKGFDPSTLKHEGLSDNTILGNLFMFGLAGHETTAHTITFAVYSMLQYPEWQEWICQEIDEVLGPRGNFGSSSLDYDELFKKLQRCRAIMYETLRLYPPVAILFRTSPPHPISMTLSPPNPSSTNNAEVVIPPNTWLFPNIPALHTHPCWGRDRYAFNPARWFAASPDSQPPTSESPILLPFQSPPRGVPRGAYLPWADGPRVCPGKKFAAVEFVAALVALLRGGARLEAVPEGDESPQEVRARVGRTIAYSASQLTLGMLAPERIAVRRVVR